MTHILYVSAAYGGAALVLGAIVAWIWVDGRLRRREIAELEAAGARRRSQRPAAS